MHIAAEPPEADNERNDGGPLMVRRNSAPHFFSGNSLVKVAEPRFELLGPNAVTVI